MPARFPPGSRGFVAAIVTAQVLTQIGAFTLPALLPGYIERWSLSKTEAGWLIGIFFAAYVPAVPVLLALTDRLPARRIYLIGTGLTALSHLGFAMLADGFWSGFLMRALAGIGWAGAYMPGLKAITDPLEGNAQSRAVSWHAAGVGIAGAISFAIAGLLDALGGSRTAFLFGAAAAAAAFLIAATIMPSTQPRPRTSSGALLDFRPVFRNRRAMAWIVGYTVTYLGTRRTPRVGGHVSYGDSCRAWRATVAAIANGALYAGGPRWRGDLCHWQRDRPAIRPQPGRAVGDDDSCRAVSHGRLDQWGFRDARRRRSIRVEYGNLHRQFGTYRRHRPSCRSASARCHDGVAFNVGLHWRISWSAWGRTGSRRFRRQQRDRLGPRLRSSRHHHAGGTFNPAQARSNSDLMCFALVRGRLARSMQKRE